MRNLGKGMGKVMGLGLVYRMDLREGRGGGGFCLFGCVLYMVCWDRGKGRGRGEYL